MMVIVLAAVGCGTGTGDTGGAPTVSPAAGADRGAAGVIGPAERAVAVVTEGCGSASDVIGSGVLLDAGHLLTSAHVVAGASRVRVVPAFSLPDDRSWPLFSPPSLFPAGAEAEVAVIDHRRDLALVVLADGVVDDGPVTDALIPPRPAVAPADTEVEIHGVTSARPLTGRVAEVTTIVTDEVRGTDRVRRSGYLLSVATTRGDSGAGVWSADGDLVGLVFAVSRNDRTRTWAVDGDEIAGFLSDAESGTSDHRCDPASSRLEPIG